MLPPTPSPRRLNKSAGVSDGPGIITLMEDKKLIQALLFTLVDAYGNTKVYHPDGKTTFEVAELLDRYLRTDAPKGEALVYQDLESSIDSAAHQFLGELGQSQQDADDISEAYHKFIDLVRKALLAKFPTTKFASF